MKQIKTIKISIYTLIFILFVLNANAQSERKFVRSGNKLYNLALADTTKLDTVNFSNAEVEYRKALAERPEELKWKLNLGNSLYKQKNTDEAEKIFRNVAENSDKKEEKAAAYHNLGNCFAVNSKFDEAIKEYKNALRNNPADLETKYNLLWAMEQKKKQDQQNNQNKDQNKDNKDQQEQEQNKDNKNNDKQDQNKDDKNKQDQNQNKQDKNNNNQDNNNQDKQDGGQQPQKISKDNAEQMLQALENDEKQTQEKVKKAQALQAKQRKTDKDW